MYCGNKILTYLLCILFKLYFILHNKCFLCRLIYKTRIKSIRKHTCVQIMFMVIFNFNFEKMCLLYRCNNNLLKTVLKFKTYNL